MKKTLLYTIFIIILLASVCVAAYPFISNYLNSLNADSEVVQYLSVVEDESDLSAVLESAHEYNRELARTTSVVNDPFDTAKKEDDYYFRQLSVDGTEVMATIEISTLNINLPIYHTTSEEVLKKGIGHLSASSLPVGSKGTHAVITGHSGYSAMRLFSDIDKLVVSDVFAINVCGERLYYEVDNIATVLPHETDLLQIDPEKDYVTLVTCTPFGVNSHRLLVRGERISDEQAQEVMKTQTPKKQSTWASEYLYAITLSIVVTVLILVVFFSAKLAVSIYRKRKNEK